MDWHEALKLLGAVAGIAAAGWVALAKAEREALFLKIEQSAKDDKTERDKLSASLIQSAKDLEAARVSLADALKQTADELKASNERHGIALGKAFDRLRELELKAEHSISNAELRGVLKETRDEISANVLAIKTDVLSIIGKLPCQTCEAGKR